MKMWSVVALTLALCMMCGLFVSAAPSPDGVVTHQFSLQGCYSSCPCDVGGMEQACADCKQQCEDRYWKEFDKKVGDDN